MSNSSDGLPRFEMSREGRGGHILYQEGERRLHISFETTYDPALDILMAPVNLSRWMTPPGEKVPLSKQREILTQLREWLTKKRIRSDIESRPSTDSGQRCIWADCANPQLKGIVHCAYHFDLMLLEGDGV
jgi:hypothetical protein